MIVGPETFLIYFDKLFTQTPLAYKEYLAEQLNPIYKDMLAKLECVVDPCDNIIAGIAAVQFALGAIEPHLPSGGGGGGGGS